VLALFNSFIAMPQKTWTFFYPQAKEDYIANHFFLLNRHVGKKTKPPEVLDGPWNIWPRNPDFIANAQTSNTNDGILLSKKGTLNGDGTNLIFLRIRVIVDR